MIEVVQQLVSESGAPESPLSQWRVRVTLSSNVPSSEQAQKAAEYLESEGVATLLSDLVSRLILDTPLKPLAFLTEVIRLRQLKREETKSRRSIVRSDREGSPILTEDDYRLSLAEMDQRLIDRLTPKSHMSQDTSSVEVTLAKVDCKEADSPAIPESAKPEAASPSAVSVDSSDHSRLSDQDITEVPSTVDGRAMAAELRCGPDGSGLRRVESAVSTGEETSKRSCFGCDIGGSLAKICFFEPDSLDGHCDSVAKQSAFLKSKTKYGESGFRDEKLSFRWQNGIFHFLAFETARMEQALQLWKDERLLMEGEAFYATGGGAHKYAGVLRSQLGVSVRKGDEFQCLLRGLNFMLSSVKDEVYSLKNVHSKEMMAERPERESLDLSQEGSLFPYLLVNMGSGTSILRVDSPTSFERVSGSCIGGGTYWGLCRLLVSEELTFSQSFDLAVRGDPNSVNMTVSDIYGGDYSAFGLKGDIVAAQFGKLGRWKTSMSGVRKEDIARALLDMIGMNAAQLAYMNALQQKVSRIFFAGNFLRQNNLAMAMISFAINFWSQGEMKACFLKHEGYFGSLGVFLMDDSDLA